MKIFTYNKAVAMRGRPKFSSPLKRIFYNAEQGKDKAFLLSEKGRIYMVEGEGVVDFPSDQLEQAAFEKYAAMRNMKLWMLVSVNSAKMRFGGSIVVLDCDLYDYHEKVLLKNQTVKIAKVYKNCGSLWKAVREFDNMSVNVKRLSINKEHQRLADESEYEKMHVAVSVNLMLSVLSFVLALFVMALFFFFGLFFALKGIVKFSKIVKSVYLTRKRSAYACVACIMLAVACLIAIVAVFLRAN